MKMAFVAMETDQNGAVDLVSVGLDLSVGNGVVVQHGLQVGPVGREVWEQDSFHGLQTQKKNKQTKTDTLK